MTAPEPKTPWYQPTLRRVLFPLLAVEAAIFVLAKCGWFGLVKQNIEIETFDIAFLTVTFTPFVVLVWFLLGVGIRRRFQYRLRSLLLLMLLVSISMSWYAVKRQRMIRQRDAADAIKELGGNVRWDGSMIRESSVLSEVTDVIFVNGHVADAALQRLREFPHLRWLDLKGSDITDDQLEYVEGLRALDWLNLEGTKITDSGLEHIKPITTLGGLQLSNTLVTNAGVEELRRALPHCDIRR